MCDLSIVEISSAVLAAASAYIALSQGVYLKRRDDARAVERGVDLLRRAADLARRRECGAGDNLEGWRLSTYWGDLLRLEMTHRPDDVQDDILALYERSAPLFNAAAGGDLLEFDAIEAKERELTEILMAMLHALSFRECLRQMIVPKGAQILGLRTQPPARPPRQAPTLS